MAIKLNYKTVR